MSGAYASIGLYETPSAEIREKAIGLLEDLGAIEYADRRYETLSQGKTKSLDCKSANGRSGAADIGRTGHRAGFYCPGKAVRHDYIYCKQRKAPSILYVTHHAEEILPVFDKALLLKQGEVFSSGEIKEMLTDHILSAFLIRQSMYYGIRIGRF